MNKPSVSVVRGPKGIPICINDLPPDHTTRWVGSKKEIVASAVRGGLLSVEEAEQRYRLSSEELQAWLDRISGNVLAGAPVRGVLQH